MKFCETHRTYFHRAKSIENHQLYTVEPHNMVWEVYDAEPDVDPDIEPVPPEEEVLLVRCRSSVCELDLHREVGPKDRLGKVRK